MKVLWLANIPSPYRVNFFNELGKNCELTVLFEREASSERDDSWKKFNTTNFSAVFLKGLKIGVAEAICPSVRKYLKKEYDHIVVTNFSDPTGMIAIQTLRARRIPYEIESDGAFSGTGKGLKESVKRYFISGAERYFSTAALHDQYYMMYGAPKERIVRYPFTSVFDKDVLPCAVQAAEKQTIRDKLGIHERKMVLAVGQFIPRKGFDILIESAKYLKKEYGIYIVGGKPTEEYKVLAEGLDNVHFVGFKNPDELKLYYQAADVFAHPTREDIWGLVINEAMANGIPVVTTDRCIAGLEMVTSEDIGRIVSAESAEELAFAIEHCTLYTDGNRIIDIARKYTFETMVNVHLETWN